MQHRTSLTRRWLTGCFAGAVTGAIAGVVAGLLTARGSDIAIDILLSALLGIAVGYIATAILLGLLFAVNFLSARTWTDMECAQVGGPTGAITMIAVAVLAETMM